MEIGQVRSFKPKKPYTKGSKTSQKGPCYNYGKIGHLKATCRTTAPSQGNGMNRSVHQVQRKPQGRPPGPPKKQVRQVVYTPASTVTNERIVNRLPIREIRMINASQLSEAWNPEPQLAHLGAPIYGINQSFQRRNVNPALRLVRHSRDILSDSIHTYHGILPINWCRIAECTHWEHKNEADPGEPN